MQISSDSGADLKAAMNECVNSVNVCISSTHSPGTKSHLKRGADLFFETATVYVCKNLQLQLREHTHI